MPALVRHFAIHAEDVPRARSFYEAVLGWTFAPWGPPNFYQILDAGPGLRGALQERHEPLSGTGLRGYEVTIGVDDLAETMRLIEAHGGRILSQPFRIEGVGELVQFEDSEGNRVVAMHYEPGVFD
jgi:hypothetical protein